MSNHVRFWRTPLLPLDRTSFLNDPLHNYTKFAACGQSPPTRKNFRRTLSATNNEHCLWRTMSAADIICGGQCLRRTLVDFVCGGHCPRRTFFTVRRPRRTVRRSENVRGGLICRRKFFWWSPPRIRSEIVGNCQIRRGSAADKVRQFLLYIPYTNLLYSNLCNVIIL